jgi:hypothetical protein
MVTLCTLPEFRRQTLLGSKARIATSIQSAPDNQEVNMTVDPVCSSLEQIEQLLKIVALTGAGLFFVWKLFTGWLIINLKLSIKLDRAFKADGKDHLGITILFEKGTTDSIWLKRVSARAKWEGDPGLEPIDFSEELNWLVVTDKNIKWDQKELGNGTIALSPGESTTFARTTVVPSDAAVVVEVVAFGERNFWPRGFQWRASAVSLPLPQAAAADLRFG